MIELFSFNPHGKAVEELPIIYGFNNGGSPGFFEACLLAEDGHWLGSHLCSSEGYMLGDLGMLEGRRSDRQDTFKKHYPDGFRMEFISHIEAKTHAGLEAAYQKSIALGVAAKAPEGESAKVEITISDK